MQFLTSVLLLAGLSSTYAAPAAMDPAQKQFQAEIQKAMEPVQTEVRAMIGNARAAAEDMVKGVSEAQGNLVDAGKNFLTPAENMDRANIGGEIIQRALNLGKQIQQDTRNMYARAVQDIKPVLANERSAVFNLRDAVGMLENKYLTTDGQEMAKMVMKAVGVA